MIQALLVLGCGVTVDRKPSEEFKARLDRAIQVVNEFDVSLVIVAGRGVDPFHAEQKRPSPPDLTEAHVGAVHLRENGLSEPRVRVLQESLSMETLGNYIFSTAAFLQPLRVSKVVTVTSPGHSNRCHRYARRLWPPSVEHIVVHGGQVSVKTEIEELARSDYVSDFVNGNDTDQLVGALRWVKEKNPDKCESYPALHRGIEDLHHQLTKDRVLHKLVYLLEDRFGELHDWMSEFTLREERTRRRRMYRAFVEQNAGPFTRPDVTITKSDCTQVFRAIGRLGVMAHGTIDPEVCALLVHHIPIKFRRILQGRFDFASEDRELRLGFMNMVKLAVEQVKAQGRQVVRIRSGQGGSEALEPFSIENLDEMKDEAVKMLVKHGW